MRPLLLLLAFAFVPACTPSIDETCNKMIALHRSDAATRGKPFPADREAKTREKCLADMHEMDGRDPDAYKCSADCIKRVKELDFALTCVSLCDYTKEKKPAAAPSTVVPLPSAQ